MLRRLRFELPLAVLTLAAIAPLWVVRRLPMQDLPQHLAAIRVLVDYNRPELQFARFFEIDLWRTQYIAYYLVTSFLAWPFGVVVANTLVLSAALAATPYAMRSLLRSLGHDERLSLFTLPLLYNVHLILGFFNFVAAIPLMLAGLALAVRLREGWTHRGAFALAVLALVLFLTHVVPFGLFALGAFALFVGGSARATIARLWPLVPSGLVALAWSRWSAAGRATFGAATGGRDGTTPPAYVAPSTLLERAPSWLTDIALGPVDEIVLIATILIAFVLVALARPQGARAPATSTPNTRTRSTGAAAGDTTLADSPREREQATSLWLRPRITWLAPLSALFYFVLPAGYDWIWPINARFPLLAVLLAIPLLPRARGRFGTFAFVVLAAFSLVSFVGVGHAFVRVDRTETVGLDKAIAAIPPGQKVAGLMFDRDSAVLRSSPFLHTVAWVQAERGGAVMFSFADFPQSPLHFRSTARPPRVPPTWEWRPQDVRPDRDLLWYDYVLVRGGPSTMAGSQVFQPIAHSGRWSVYRRKPATPQGAAPQGATPQGATPRGAAP